jgi:O-acetyl-ADP-ribose deacetylase (regulator of RNase III)
LNAEFVFFNSQNQTKSLIQKKMSTEQVVSATVTHINANILDVHQTHQVQCILHQINCISVHAQGLAGAIADKWYWANPYCKRKQKKNLNLAVWKDRLQPGTMHIWEPPPTKKKANSEDDDPTRAPLPVVIGLAAQFSIGPPLRYNYQSAMLDDIRQGYTPPDAEDSCESRLRWFRMALKSAAEWITQHGIERIAVPFRIGCGLAGGNWSIYQRILKNEFLVLLPAHCTLYICNAVQTPKREQAMVMPLATALLQSIAPLFPRNLQQASRKRTAAEALLSRSTSTADVAAGVDLVSMWKRIKTNALKHV